MVGASSRISRSLRSSRRTAITGSCQSPGRKPRGVTNPIASRWYALNSPIQVEGRAPPALSGVTEAVLFLQVVNGEVKGPQVFNMLWNHTEKAVINEPSYKAVFSDWTRLRGALQRAAAERAPQDKVDALKAERAEVEKKLNAWTGVSHIYNPEMNLDQLPRLLLESVEIEGPIQREWPPAVTKRFSSTATNAAMTNTKCEMLTASCRERIAVP